MFPPSSLSSRDEKEMEYIFKADELKTGCFPIVKTETTVLWKKATSYFRFFRSLCKTAVFKPEVRDPF